MAEYNLTFLQTASTYVTVEADDLDEALDLAYEQLPGGVCAQCSGWGQSHSGIDLDGDWEFDESYYTVDGEEIRGE
jgi:hypothetical protein